MNMNNPDRSDTSAPDSVVMLDIRHLSPNQLAQLGVAQLAYVRPVVANGVPAFAIHAADGTPMALAPSCELAVAAVRQHEMIAALVH